MIAEQYLGATKMLNYHSNTISSLVKTNGWGSLDTFSKIGAIYNFVQNEILFGYNKSDNLSATEVLADGIGQCNTKSTLLMALLRAVNIPCRLHASKVSKDFQAGAINRFISALAPKYIIHTWVEVYFNASWISLEGVILDKLYLSAVQKKYPLQKGAFKGYAIATNCFENPAVDWNGKDTFIQREAVIFDYGVFTTPDDFFTKHKQPLCFIKQLLYTHIGRHIMTMNVAKIRNQAAIRRK